VLDQSEIGRGSGHRIAKPASVAYWVLPEKEDVMGELVHTSRIKIVRERGPTRKAMIEGFAEPIFYGVHGGIKQFYKVEPEKEHAATLDHIVAATAA
jgi:hypothetical protein